MKTDNQVPGTFNEDICNICYDSYENDTEVILCSSCLHGFHTPHLASWFYFRDNSCPVCRSLFDSNLVDRVLPTSPEEIRRIQKIDEVFQQQPIPDQPSVRSQLLHPLVLIAKAIGLFVVIGALFVIMLVLLRPALSPTITYLGVVCFIIWLGTVRRMDQRRTDAR